MDNEGSKSRPGGNASTCQRLACNDEPPGEKGSQRRRDHNEYLQLLVELGAIGLLLLLGLVIVIARAVVNARPRHPSAPLWAGAAGGLLALAVGSGVDFLWHVPAVPLVGALLFALTVPNAKEKNQL